MGQMNCIVDKRNREVPQSKEQKEQVKPESAVNPKLVEQQKKFKEAANNPSSSSSGSTFGMPIEKCLPSASNIYLPRFVEVCTKIIDERGLQTVGIYRVPGNNASITALTEEVNKNFDEVPLDDPRWNDLHVVGSLLKSFFRKMPDSLITGQLYPSFIEGDNIENPKDRMERLRELVRGLPKHNYHTLKHLVLHLKRVADNCSVNKMRAQNLAIIFGPDLVWPEVETMERIFRHMTNQCNIVETLISNADWFFDENEGNIFVPMRQKGRFNCLN